MRLHVRRFCVRKTDPWPFCCLLSIIFVSCVKNWFDVSEVLAIIRVISYLIAAKVSLRHGCELCVIWQSVQVLLSRLTARFTRSRYVWGSRFVHKYTYGALTALLARSSGAYSYFCTKSSGPSLGSASGFSRSAQLSRKHFQILKPDTLFNQNSQSQWVAVDTQGLSCHKSCWTRFKVRY